MKIKLRNFCKQGIYSETEPEYTKFYSETIPPNIPPLADVQTQSIEEKEPRRICFTEECADYRKRELSRVLWVWVARGTFLISTNDEDFIQFRRTKHVCSNQKKKSLNETKSNFNGKSEKSKLIQLRVLQLFYLQTLTLRYFFYPVQNRRLIIPRQSLLNEERERRR